MRGVELGGLGKSEIVGEKIGRFSYFDSHTWLLFDELRLFELSVGGVHIEGRSRDISRGCQGCHGCCRVGEGRVGWVITRLTRWKVEHKILRG